MNAAVQQTATDIAPLQGAAIGADAFPGVSPRAIIFVTFGDSRIAARYRSQRVSNGVTSNPTASLKGSKKIAQGKAEGRNPGNAPTTSFRPCRGRTNDDEGKRVKKLTYDEEGDPKDVTVFVYSAGRLIAEYTTEAPPEDPTTRFTVTDQLGSPRVILDSAGDVVSRRDFLPFGEEIAPDGTYRKTDDEYGQADHVRQKFTGYQNDAETGLDFAEARMYENRHGRFTAVDPLLASGKSADPQTFNRYVYVMNNPVVLTDPTGLQVGTPKPGELGSDENPYRVNTESRSWWSKIKDGIKDSFNKFIRALAPVDNFYHEEDIDFQERKRGGEDKQVGNALRNYAKGSEELYQAMESVDQTGVLELNRALVNNSLGRASDEEVYGAFGNALLNTALTAAPGGRAAKTAENVSAPVRGWVVRKIFGNLDEPIKKKVVSALKTGIVAPKGKQGVIRLSESEAQKTGYTHKVKILGKGGDLRIYGRQQENGLIVFDKIGKH